MKHFSTEEWVNFVNQAVTTDQLEAMRKHLATGCKPCAETVAVWEKVKKTAAAEASYQPSTDTLRIAKAAFAASGLARKKTESSLVEVLFDSFLQPAVASARSAAASARQMLYRAGPYQIDIQVEPQPGTNRIVVTGQLLTINQPGTAGSDIQVTLSNHRGHSVIATTNQFGEFSGEIENSGDLELSIPSDTGRPIAISLRGVLGDLPGGKS